MHHNSIQRSVFTSQIGLQRVRDSLLGQLRDLNKSKPRSKADENLITEISRLESLYTVTKDDLVRTMAFHCLTSIHFFS